jgi:hypothetical protein
VNIAVKDSRRTFIFPYAGGTVTTSWAPRTSETFTGSVAPAGTSATTTSKPGAAMRMRHGVSGSSTLPRPSASLASDGAPDAASAYATAASMGAPSGLVTTNSTRRVRPIGTSPASQPRGIAWGNSTSRSPRPSGPDTDSPSRRERGPGNGMSKRASQPALRAQLIEPLPSPSSSMVSSSSAPGSGVFPSASTTRPRTDGSRTASRTSPVRGARRRPACAA